MKYTFITSENIEKGTLDELNKEYYLYISIDNLTPYEVFSNIPFITNSESGLLSENETAIIVFEEEISVLKALNMIKEIKDNPIEATVIHEGMIIDSNVK